DQLLEPRGAGGLHMDPRAGALQTPANRAVNRELVASRMHAELEVRRQVIALPRVCNYGEIVAKFFLEPRDISDVVDAFIETPGEFCSDGLKRNLLARQ